MLSRVSWSEYAGVVIILLVIYYAFVGIKYYRNEIMTLLSGKLPKKNGTSKKEADQKGDEFSDTSTFDELEMTVNDIRYAILDKAGKQTDKAELSFQLKQRLANYTGLRKPAYRVAINNYIITHAKEICGVVYNADELNAIWDSLPR